MSQWELALGVSGLFLASLENRLVIDSEAHDQGAVLTSTVASLGLLTVTGINAWRGMSKDVLGYPHPLTLKLVTSLL